MHGIMPILRKSDVIVLSHVMLTNTVFRLLLRELGVIGDWTKLPKTYNITSNGPNSPSLSLVPSQRISR
jgi:hypothetical protein